MTSRSPSCIHDIINVIHVDDEKDQLRLTKFNIEGSDPSLKVKSVQSPFEALRLLGEKNYDCLVSDYTMPGLDGIELARKIRETSSIPIILYTGHGSEEVAEAAFMAGVDDYVRKEMEPSHYRVLAKGIRQVVERHRIEELHRSVTEGSGEAFCILVETNCVYANKAMADLLGVSRPEELIGRDILEWNMEEDREWMRKRILNRQMGEPQPDKYEFTITRSDGRLRRVETSVSLIRYLGRPASLSFLRDVTDRLKYQERLEALHSHVTKLTGTETIHDIATATVNTIENALGFDIASFGVVEDGVLKFMVYNGGREDPTPGMPLDGPGITVRAARTGETQLVPDVRKDGDYFNSLAALLRKEILSELDVPVKVDGGVVAVINLENERLNAFNDDDRKLLEILAEHVSSAIARQNSVERLRESEKRYRTFLESSLDGVFLWTDEKYSYANKRAADLLGFSDPSEIVGIGVIDLVAPEERARIEPMITARLRGEPLPNRYELKLQKKDGTVIDVETQISRIEFDGKPASLAFTHEITERIRYQKQLEALYEHTLLLSEAKSLEEIIDATLDAIEHVISFEYLTFGIVEDDKMRFIPAKGDITIFELPLDGPGITVRAARTGKSQLVNDTRKDGDYIAIEPDGAYYSLSELIVPVKVEGKTIAVINVESERSNAFTEKDQRLIEFLAEHVASAMKQLEFLESEYAYQAKIEALHDSAAKLSSAKDVDEVGDIVVKTFEQVLGFQWAGIGFVEDGSIRHIKNVGIETPQDFSLPLDGRGITVRAVRTCRTQLVNDVRPDPDFLSGNKDAHGVPKTLSELAVPVLLNGDAVAVINLEDERLGVFDADDQKLIETLAMHVSSAVERIRNVELLRASEEKYRTLAENAADILITIDLEGCFTYISKKIEPSTGYSYDDLVGRNISEFLAPESAEVAFKRIRAWLSGARSLPPYVVRMKTVRGDEVPFELTTSPIVKDGKTLGVQVVARDVSERIRYREKLEALHEHGVRLNAIKGVDEVVDRTLNAMSSTLGFDNADFLLVDGGSIQIRSSVGKKASIIEFPLDGAGVVVKVVHMKKTMVVPDTRLEPSFVNVRPAHDGGLEILSEMAVPVLHEGEVVAVLNVESVKLDAFTDEDKKLLEILAWHVSSALGQLEHVATLERMVDEKTRELIAAEQMAAAGKVAAMVGHDLRGPLQAIKNAVYLFRLKPDKADEALKTIDDAVDRSARMLNEVGQMTRGSPSKIEPLDLSAIVSSAIEDASVPESIEVELKTEGSLSEVPVDALKMRRCLHNLITNAIDAMPKGGKITISMARVADGASIRVSDTGVGVAPEALSKIFKPFYTTKPKGWGLGLSYCKRAVEDHGGTITVESAVGRGTTFNIFIPIRAAAASYEFDLMYRYDEKDHAYVRETPTGRR